MVKKLSITSRQRSKNILCPGGKECLVSTFPSRKEQAHRSHSINPLLFSVSSSLSTYRRHHFSAVLNKPFSFPLN